MSPQRKHVMVGVTVLGGLLLLAWMLLKFGDRPVLFFAHSNTNVHILCDRADGLAEGSPVYYRGVNVGRVSKVERQANEKDVLIETLLDDKPPLPGNVKAYIRTSSLVGGAAKLDLDVLPTEEPSGELASGATLKAEFRGLDLLPPEFAQLAAELRQTAETLRKSNLIQHLDEAVQTIQKQVAHAGDLLDSTQSLISDPKMRENLTQAIANLRSTTENANRVSVSLEKNIQRLSDDASATMSQARTTLAKADTKVDDIGKQLSARLEQTAKLLETFQSISAKVDKGQGTAGLMVNDNKLYQSLVDTSRELNATITDLKRLVEQWEEEGVSLRVK